MSDLPRFTYHPDPLATGSIVASSETCECCGEARGFVYWPTPYGPNLIESLCPWCIDDGSAHEKLGAEFVDGHPLARDGIARPVIDEVTMRTPGYICWHQEDWLSCCNDACEFHGDAAPEELRALDAKGLQRLSADSGFPVEHLPKINENYEPRGAHGFYKFKCRHCGEYRYGGDCM